MLQRKHLGRRHQRALPAGLDRTDERGERNGSLTGADVALEQALHRLIRVEVALNRLEGSRLGTGQLEGQRRHEMATRSTLTRFQNRKSEKK